MSQQATLRTARLELVPLSPDHGDYVYQLDSDAEVMKYIGYGKPLSASDSAIVHKLLLETATFGSGLGCWAGFAGDEFVGWWVLAPSQSSDTPPQVNKKRVEFGLRLLPKFWGRGYAKEGSRELVRHGLEDLDIEEVFGETMAVNEGSRAIMAKIGLRHVRTFHNKYDNPPPGIEEGEVEYRITRDEWAALDQCRK
ncbi:GNAT family acetyltransferase [Fusarium albosuccineum]|uniref:GNAT family acetyltransferase n=1 Tax=Fusarium albosuccineum TaxID=1237068 RepID=A0A8H4LN71_9HYPO|nr:GNAT family acetyltransferase [Fusarium albosuccineum]